MNDGVMEILAKAERPAGCETIILAQEGDDCCYCVQYQWGFNQAEKRFEDPVKASELFMRFVCFFASQTNITDHMIQRWFGEG